jgi:hypothetical protein
MDDRLRGSDAYRDVAAALLRDHFAAGRLTTGELDERLEVILDAKTAGDLRQVLADLPGTAAALREASPGSPQAGQLERGYRRLLVCYPAWYRRLHEEEILAVLMTGAPRAKRRPGFAEAADLLWGALRIRCQPARTRGAEPAWRDALAILSVIVPLIIVVSVVVNEARALVLMSGSPLAGRFLPWALKRALRDLAVPLAMAALIPLALRMRRLAALAGTGLLILVGCLVYSLPPGLPVGDIIVLPAIGLQTAALAASPGPRRGLKILTWQHSALVVTATVLFWTSVIPISLGARLIMLAAIGAAMALTSPLGRWLALLLAIPAYPLFVFGWPPFSPAFGWGEGWRDFPPSILTSTPVLVAACYLPSAVLTAVAAVAARRASSRPSEPFGAPDA